MRNFIVFLILFTGIYRVENGESQENNKNMLIHKYFKPEIKYNAFQDIKSFIKIIKGEWIAPPYSKITFYDNAEMKIENNEFNKEIIINGKWAIKDSKSLWLFF